MSPKKALKIVSNAAALAPLTLAQQMSVLRARAVLEQAIMAVPVENKPKPSGAEEHS